MTGRVPSRPIDPLILDRWSPRAFTDEPISPEDLATILEAARWAPSAFNMQPWRFVHARRDTPAWAPLLDLLMPFNRDWAQRAAALVFVASDSLMRQPGKEPSPSHSHSFDAGAAWGLLALQAAHMGWRTHAMTGVDFERARSELGFPDGFRMEAAIAVGREGDPASLNERLRARETPSGRNALETLAFEGRFTG